MENVRSLIFPEGSLNSLVSLKNAEHNTSDLPPKALLNIFSYFTEDELRKLITPVCQRWKEIGEEPFLWKTLKFSSKQIPNSYICEKIRQFKLVKTIYVKYAEESKIIVRQIARCSENLTHLVLRHCLGLTEDSLRFLITSCKNLKSLDLKASPFKGLIFYDELLHANALEEVNFSENPHFSVKFLLNIVINLRNISGIHLSNFKPNDNVLLNDVDCYFILTHTVFNLKFLTLDCSSLASYTFASIFKCKQLEYLCLNYAFNLEGKEFEHLWQTLTKLKSLKIRFAHNINNSNLVGLFTKGKKVMKKLEVVDLTGCTQVGDDGLKALSNCCCILKSLVVRNCLKVTTVKYVVDTCDKLEVLNVAFCKNLYLNNHKVPTKLKEFFIYDNADQKNFSKLIRELNTNTVIRLCLNEFNKITVRLYFRYLLVLSLYCEM